MFENFGKKLTVLGQNVAKKTGEVAELASLKTKVLSKKKKAQDELLALGKAYYEAHKDETTEFADKITAINDIYTEIESLEAEFQELKEKLPEGVKLDDIEDIFESEDGETAAEESAETTAEETAEAPAEETAAEEPAEASAEETPAEETTETPVAEEAAEAPAGEE